jgi:hypothetical protein
MCGTTLAEQAAGDPCEDRRPALAPLRGGEHSFDHSLVKRPVTTTMSTPGGHGAPSGIATVRGLLQPEVGSAFELLGVRAVDPTVDSRVEAFVVAHPHGLIYHHPMWLRILQREDDQPSTVLACEDAAGRLRGILPLCVTPIPVGGPEQCVGRRVSSLPRTPVAGPLALDREATAALVRAAIERTRAVPGARLELRTQATGLERLVDGLVYVPGPQTRVLELRERSAGVRLDGLARDGPLPWAIREEIRSGVRIRSAESEEDLRAWYELYVETRISHVLPARPYRLFAAAWELLRPCGYLRLLLAERRAEGSSRLLAGALFLMLGRTVFRAFTACRPEAVSPQPHDLVQWQAIQDACREGFRRYDLGEVAPHHEWLAELENHGEARSGQLYRYYYPAPAPAEASRLEGDRFSVGLAYAV